MKKHLSSLSLAALATLVVAAAALAEPVPYKIDVNHSEVSFKIRHFFSKTPGRFNEYEGTILFDDKKIENSSVDVTIQAASIYTNQEKRDPHLRSEDFFYVEKFPTLTFKSTKIVPGEAKKFKIEGDLTMRGVTKPVVLDAEWLGSGTIAIDGRPAGTRAGFTATTTVNRKDYGINWNRTLDQGGVMLGDDVEIALNVEAIQFDPKAAASKPAQSDKAPAKTEKAEKTAATQDKK